MNLPSLLYKFCSPMLAVTVAMTECCLFVCVCVCVCGGMSACCSVCLCVVCVGFVFSCCGSSRLEDVLCGSVRHDSVHVQRWEQLQALDSLRQRDTSPPLAGCQGRRLRQEEPRLPSTDCRHGSVSHPDQVYLYDIVIPLIEMCGCDWFKSRHVV